MTKNIFEREEVGLGSRVVNVSWGRDVLGVLMDWLRFWVKERGDPMSLGDVRIFLPNRRSVRALRRRLLGEFSVGGALIFPHIEALGDVDLSESEGDMGERGGEEIFPTGFDVIERELILFRFVWKWLEVQEGEFMRGERRGYSMHQALGLSRSLGVLMDELDIQEIGVEEIDGLVPEDLADHWKLTRDFLLILKDHWPRVCAERGQMNGMAIRMSNLRRLSAYWEREAVDFPVLIVGSTGSVPATASLMKVVSRLPRGKVVLPGVDKVMDEESWEAVGEDMAHPQHGLFEVLKVLGVSRGEVKEWGGGSGEEGEREILFSRVMMPSKSGGMWRDKGELGFSGALKGLGFYEGENEEEEILYAAGVLREVLEREGKTCAFVCPDEGLRRGVISELRRWDVEVDDSSGRVALDEGDGVLVGLLLGVLIEGGDPGKWEGLLSHPLCLMGRERSEVLGILEVLQRWRRESDEKALTLEGLESQLKRWGRGGSREKLGWSEARECVREFRKEMARRFGRKRETLEGYVERFIGFCEYVSGGSDGVRGKLWKSEEGVVLAEILQRIRMYGSDWDFSEDVIYLGMIVRDFLREGRFHPLGTNQPRLMVLEPMELRLQSFGCVVLGGLNEGVWPGDVGSSPWMSRPMRKKLGLMSHERRVGMQAHDFVRSCGAAEVILTRSKMKGDEPALESRWIARLRVVMKGRGLCFDEGLGGRGLAAVENLMRGAPSERYGPPCVKLGADMFPLKVSVTGFDRLRNNPYVYYVEKVLRLKAPSGDVGKNFYRERGILLHGLMEDMARYSELHPHEGVEGLRKNFSEVLEEKFILETEIPKMLKQLWGEKWQEIAGVYGMELLRVREETERVLCEEKGEVVLREGVILHGKADRLDVMKEGGLRIVDLKTGTLASKKAVESMEASQLVLLSLLAKKGGYESLGEGVDVNEVESSLYRLGTKKEEKRVSVNWREQGEDWLEEAESMVVDEVIPYVRGVKEVKMSWGKGVYGESDYRALTRFDEWGYGD